MHICIPDTREVRPAHGSAFLLYNIHIDGLYHCSLRFKQLLHLHQALSKKFASNLYQLPPFPPKKLLPLSANQVEERRQQLEKYLQNIGQDKTISNSSILNLFLLEAQRESTRIRESQVHLDVELVNGQKIRLQIVTHDSADTVLTAVCRALNLPDRYHAYFCLCLCGYDVVRDKLIIKRRLSFFESPFITLQMAIQQQEQLQNILATSSNYLSTTNCRCLSCSTTQQQQLHSTCVPLLGSSSGSYVNNNNNQQQQQAAGHYNQTYHHLQNGFQWQQQQQQQHLASSSSSSGIGSSSSSTSSSSRHSFVTHRILLRKSYWDPIYDTYILNDQQALNLLFIQTVYDIKHSLMFVDRETYHQLESLLASDSKLEYILLARTLKYYNYVHFEPCYSDYPRPRTKVMISIGSKELNMRVLKHLKSITSTAGGSQSSTSSSASSSPSEPILYCASSLVPSGYQHMITKGDIVEEEYNFKVPLIRCWRLTSLETLNSGGLSHHNHHHNHRNSISSSATITLAGGRRRSLSLFNSVVGNALGNNNNETNQNCRQHYRAAANGGADGNTIISGTDGASLLATLAGRGQSTNGNSFLNNNSNGIQINNHLNHQYCQHENQCCEPIQADHAQLSQYELSFEYLISKDTLKWITISSDQAIFISISLQGVVDELVSKRDGRGSMYASGGKSNSSTNVSSSFGTDSGSQLIPPLGAQNSNGSMLSSLNQQQPSEQSTDCFTYMYRDGVQKMLNTSNQQLIDKFGTTLGYSPTNSSALAIARQRQQVRASAQLSTSTSRFAQIVTSPWSHYQEGNMASGQHQQHQQQQHVAGFEITSFKKAPSPIINDAFEGVTNDDDL